MQDVIAFWTALFHAVSDFLLTEPISWFTVIFLSLAVVGFIKRICF